MQPPVYRLRIPGGLAGLVRGMHPHLKGKIQASLQAILSNPDEQEALKEDLAGLRSFRVSRFRIIYRIRKDAVEIVAIGPRERIYEETFRLLKRETRG